MSLCTIKTQVLMMMNCYLRAIFCLSMKHWRSCRRAKSWQMSFEGDGKESAKDGQRKRRGQRDLNNSDKKRTKQVSLVGGICGAVLLLWGELI